MSDLNVHLCPETGICSIIKGDGKKIDLIPDEVSQLRGASGDPAGIRQALAEIDPAFAQGLDADELEKVCSQLK